MRGKKIAKKWFRGLAQSRFIVAILIFIQISFLIYLLGSTTKISKIINVVLYFFAAILIIHVVNQHNKGAFKISWIILLLVFPIVGIPFYVIMNMQWSANKFTKRQEEIAKLSKSIFLLPGNILDNAIEQAPSHSVQLSYLQNFAGFPVYNQSETSYYSPGQAFFPTLLGELEKAQKYIFMEYFIIEAGSMWDAIFDILIKKVKQGVDIRILYDDVGCLLRLPLKYPSILEESGIKCFRFNRFKPVLKGSQNNRDHRKITVIDGKVAFTGGINIADEYINAYEKFGYWKDSAIRIKGNAAWSFAVMFLEMWSLVSGQTEAFETFYPWKNSVCENHNDGLIQPYADSPMDKENVGEHVYLQLINNAKKYVYITTPYLIVDDNIISALSLAAKSGIDVRIITPHKWDKRLVHITTRSFYRQLISFGIKIYEYTPGFMHAKTFVSDDEVATVGTTNMDYRSLYFHFECGVWMYKSSSVMKVKEDYLETLSQCHMISEKECSRNFIVKIFQDLLRIFSPIM